MMKMMRFKHRDDDCALLDTSANCVYYPMDTASSKYQKISHESCSGPTWEEAGCEADPTDTPSVMTLTTTHAPDPEDDTGEDFMRL
jgi:hypothetical protein